MCKDKGPDSFTSSVIFYTDMSFLESSFSGEKSKEKACILDVESLLVLFMLTFFRSSLSIHKSMQR